MVKSRKPGGSPSSRPRTTPKRANKSPAIDFHAHIMVPEVVSFARKHMVGSGLPKDPRIGKAAHEKMRKKRESISSRMTDMKLRLRDMDRMGVDIQVLTASLVHQCTYWADPRKSLEMERLTNDRIAEMVDHNPERFVGLGSVPLQDTAKAVKELDRCIKELGFRGVQISSTAGKKELGDTRLRKFWAKAQELDTLVYIHPSGITDPRYQRYQLWNSVGQLLEEAMAISSLFCGGVMDEFPKLKICVAHGGGYMPYSTGRLDRNYLEKPHTRLDMRKAPSDYMRSCHYESCVYEESILQYLVQKAGHDRIVMGSDYPVGESDPVGFIQNAKGLSRAAKDAILWKTAARLLKIRDM